MFSNPWKDHRCCQWLVPHYEYKNVVEGIHPWSVNEHRRKFPPWVARQPPPIKITIKSHIFHAGIINSRMQLQPFKETRRQGQTTRQLLITRPLTIRNREAFPSSLSASSDPPTLPGAEPPAPPRLLKQLSEKSGTVPRHTPPAKKSSKHMHLQYLGCPHGSKVIRWDTPKKNRLSPRAELNLN